MKKINLILVAVFVALAGVVFVGCEKTQEIGNETNLLQDEYSEYQLPELLKTGVTVENGIMVFESAERFIEITELLEAENDKWNEDFYQKWKYLSEEEYNAKIQELNFDDEYTYNVFEEYHNFVSLRSEIKKANDNWIGHEVLEMETNPNIYAIPDPERCVYNIYGENKIGGNIYHIKKDGTTFELENNDFDLLKKIRNNQINVNSLYDNLNIYTVSEDKMECVSDGTSSLKEELYDDNTKKLVCQTYFNGYNGSSARGYSTMWTYKKVGGVWQDWNTSLGMIHTTQFYSKKCKFRIEKTDSQTKSSGHKMTVGVSRLGVHRTQGNKCSAQYWADGHTHLYCQLCD